MTLTPEFAGEVLAALNAETFTEAIGLVTAADPRRRLETSRAATHAQLALATDLAQQGLGHTVALNLALSELASMLLETLGKNCDLDRDKALHALAVMVRETFQ